MSKRGVIVLAAVAVVAVAIVAVVVWILGLREVGNVMTEVGNLITGRGPTDTTTARPVPPSSDHDMPAMSGAASTPRGDVTLDLRRQQLIGVRTAPARRVPIASDIRAVGIVRYDETRQAEINTRVDGWIRELHADYTGKPIGRGDALFTLYSPEIVATQTEYLLALRGHAQSSSADLPAVRDYSERLVQAARERLLRWDLTAEDIRALEQSGRASDTITFRSPVAGVIVEKAAVEGMRVMAGQTLFRVADLSVVWIDADVYERDMQQIRVGRAARVTLDAYPGDQFPGRVTYVYPTVNEQTRAAKVRLQFGNRDGRLKPGMYATVTLTGAETTGLTVPADALLDTGAEQVVFVARGEGYFEPRRVKAGRRIQDEVEIAEGLKEGEQVATGAAFFLDSESQLRAAVQGYQSAPGQPAAGPPSRERVDITFRAEPDPPRTGENTFEVSVKDAAGQPVADADVAVTFFMPAMPSMNMPAMRSQTKLPQAGGGVYRGPGQVVMAGRWDVTVDVSRGGQRMGSRQFALVAR